MFSTFWRNLVKFLKENPDKWIVDENVFSHENLISIYYTETYASFEENALILCTRDGVSFKRYIPWYWKPSVCRALNYLKDVKLNQQLLEKRCE